MQGPRCHAENRKGRRFCAKCAARLATCPSCGFSNEPGEDFCGGCAAPLTAAGRPVEARFESPHSYTPEHLAETILTSKAALEDREGARPHDPAVTLAAGGSGDRVMDRRSFISSVTLGLLAAPLAAEGQQAETPCS
jgi:hypothetical protein